MGDIREERYHVRCLTDHLESSADLIGLVFNTSALFHFIFGSDVSYAHQNTVMF